MPPDYRRLMNRDLCVGFRKENPDSHTSEPTLSDRKAQVGRGLDAPIPHPSHSPSQFPPHPRQLYPHAGGGPPSPTQPVALSLSGCLSHVAVCLRSLIPGQDCGAWVQPHEGMRMGGGFLLMDHRTRNGK